MSVTRNPTPGQSLAEEGARPADENHGSSQTPPADRGGEQGEQDPEGLSPEEVDEQIREGETLAPHVGPVYHDES